MNQVERFKNIVSFKPVDRLPVIEWATWWDKTIERWKSEGLPSDIQDITLISEYFKLDSLRQYWLTPYGENCPGPASHGSGILETKKQYEEYKERLYLFPEEPYDKTDLAKWSQKQSDGDTVIWMTFEGFFWFPRALFGIEKHMYAFFDKPNLIHEMNQDLTIYYVRQLEKFTELCIPAFMTIAEDMSYNKGPMLSEKQFDEFLKPYYNQIVPLIKQHGITVLVDSDGDVEQLIPWLKKAGIDGILPLERMAGVDVAKIRQRHPDFLMIGGFDKTVMSKGESAMRKEFGRLLPTMKKGGFIPSVDHQTPPDVSLDNYRCYVSLLREFCEKAVKV